MYKYLLVFFVISCIACSKNGPEPINYGKDQGAYCRMTISDPRFGAEIITGKGRVYKFDAIECMIRHLKENAPEYAFIYATTYDRPHKLQEIDSLIFAVSPDIKSPMGENLAAFSDRKILDSLFGKKAEIYLWEEIYDKIQLK